MIKTTSFLVAIFLFIIPCVLMAEPRTESAQIKLLRPYATGSYYVQVDTINMTDSNLSVGVFSVQQPTALSSTPTPAQQAAYDNARAGAQAMIATLITADAQNREVQIEIPTGTPVSPSTGEYPYGTKIQSVYLRD